ncbi:hypothetical protein ACLOJK_029218, partial [Asimina triloba]
VHRRSTETRCSIFLMGLPAMGSPTRDPMHDPGWPNGRRERVILDPINRQQLSHGIRTSAAPPSISSHGPPEISMTAPFPNPTVARSKGQPPRSGRWQQPLIIRPTAPFPMAARSDPTRQSQMQAPAQSNDGEIWRSSAALFFGFEWKSTAMAEPHQLQPDPNISPVRRDESELKFWAAMDGFRSHDIGRQRAAN